MRVLIIDPGEKCGWARMTIDENTAQWAEVRHGIAPLWDMAEAVHFVQNGKLPYDTIVAETWRLYESHAKQFIGSTFPSVQLIGALKLVCRLTNTAYVEQPASAKKLGLVRLEVDYPQYHDLAVRPVAHDDGHDQDALMHAAAFSFKRFGPRKQDWMVD